MIGSTFRPRHEFPDVWRVRVCPTSPLAQICDNAKSRHPIMCEQVLWVFEDFVIFEVVQVFQMSFKMITKVLANES